MIETTAPGHADHVRYSPIALKFTLEETFVPWESAEIARLGLSRDQLFAYAECLPQSGATRHALLGHPDMVQGDMQSECQLVSHGFYCGDARKRGWRAKRIERDAHRWRLLLQIDTDDDIGMMWGDVGRIYWWMHEDDLRSRRWDRSHLILQCS